MSSCTYKFKNASGEEVTITGQAEMKAFLADGGLEQLLPGKVLPWKDDGAKVAEKPVTPSAVTLKGPRRDPTTVSMFNPYQVGDIVTIAGQDWQIQQDMPGWYLTNTGNWRGTHPTIQRIRSMADLIREIERASTEKEAPKNEKPAPAESPKVEAKPALSYIQPSKVDTPAQGALANAIEQKSRAWSQVKTLRSRVKDGETNLRVDLLKAEDMWREAKRYEADAREHIEVEANKQGMTTKRDSGPLYEVDQNGDPSPEEAEAVQRGLEGKNPIEAAAWLAENAPPQYATIAAKVRDKLQDLSSNFGVNFGLSIVYPGAMAESELSVARGATIPVQQDGGVALRIVLNGAGMKGRVGTSYRTALHELAHAATMQSVQLGHKGFPQYAQAVRDLVDVANAINRHMGMRAKTNQAELTDFERSVLSGRSNLFDSIDEVLVWGMTSPDAQAYLESIPYKSKSLWTAFVAAVRKVLGLSESNDTALSEILRISEVLMKPLDVDGSAGFARLNSRYEIQQPHGGRAFRNPGGVDDATWTGEAVDEGAARSSALVASIRAKSEGPAVLRTEIDDDRPSRAGWTESRIDRLIGEFAYDFDSTRTKAYAAFVNPDDFLSATTPKSERDKLESEAKPLDREGLAGETQPIYLQVRETDEDGVSKIIGHEGRHRMMALRDAGYSRVPVVLIFPDAVYDASEIEEPYFIAQKFGDGTKAAKGFSARSATPITSGNRAELVEEFSSNASGNNDIRFRNDYPDTQAFREWFGNSKMTNKAGEPLLFMHGSPASFEAFDSSKLGTSSSHTSSGLGHFFTRDRATAEKYADGGDIYTGWLRIEKPYVMMLEEAQAFDDAAESAKRRAELQKQGYDGAVILDDEGKPWATVAFEPWQFKSTENNGDFDELDDRMRFRDDPSSMRDATTVPRDQAEEFIRKFVAEYPGAPQIMLSDSFYQLPEDIQSDALEQGSGPTRAKGALKNGKAYVVLNTHTSMADLEASVFHEVLGHAGIRKLLGPAFAQELNKMFIGLGGYSKLYQIMSRRGMGRQFEGYYDAVQRAREKNPEVWTEFLASSILTEEVFAHIAEQKNAKALRDRFMALVGMVRDWLRRNGFARLASLGESDIVFLLQRARAGLKNGSGVIRDGVTIGETVIVDAEGRPVAKKGSPDYEMLKAVSERMGLRETNGPTVFSNSLPEEGKPGDDARMDDTLTIDGLERPTKNSKGQPIHPTEEGIRNFWKWFGGDGLLDEDGRPMLVYHGGGAEFSGIQDKGRFGKAIFVKQGSESGYGDVQHALYLRGDVLSLGDLRRSLRGDEDNEILKAATQKDLSEDDADDLVRALTTDENYPSDEHVWDLIGAIDEADAQLEIQKLRGKVASMLGASAVETPDEFDGDTIMVVDPMAIKSATGNAGTFDPSSPITVFRTVTPEQLNAYAQPRGQAAKEVVGNLIAAFREPSSKIFNVLHKTISTPLHKASISKDYDRVFRLAQDYQNDIARFAAGPADAAPRMLPSYDSIRQAFSRLVHGNKYAKFKGAVADAIFEGTLAGEDVTSGRVWTDAELRDRYDMTDDQIGLYREARDAIDASLDSAAAGLAWQAVKKYIPDMKGAVRHEPADAEKIIDAAMRQAEDELREVARYQAEVEKDGAIPKGTAEKTLNKAKSIAEARVAAEGIFARADALKAGGYAPLMRFGKYAVDAVRKLEDGTEERITFMRFESELEAKMAAQKIRKLHPDAEVKRSIISEEAWKIYKGVDPELVSLFAESLDGVEGLSVKEDVLQEWYRNAVSERSSFKRMIHRKGTDGFDRDITRVLASFITSNSRLAARQFNMGDISEALADMNERKVSGDVLDDATGLKEYIDNPEKPFKAMKGMMFAFFLGGSVASAALNLTQPMMMTFPYLSQYGARKAGAALRGAAAEAAKGSVSDKELGRALSRATKDGIVDPQQIHHLYHESLRSFLAKLPLGEGLQERAQGLMTLWGMMFGATENFNRRLTFIAAYRMAKDDPSMGNPYDFAAKAVEETQGIYNDANIPNWARGNGSFGALGVAAFTFKQYSIGYVELLIRLAKSGKNGRKGAAIMLGTLVLMSGMQGAPGADDLEDVIDTVAQYMGYTGNSRLALRKSLESGLGNVFAQETAKEMAHIIMYGGLSFLPGDLASRTGLGNLFPATAIAKPSEQNRGSQIAEIFGPPLGMANQVLDATLAMESGAGALGVASAFAPVAVRNWIKAYDMASTGQYRDTKGRKVVDVTAGDVALKAIGIQPTVVSDDTKSARLVNLTKQRITQVKSAISSLKAQGIADRNPEMKARADAMVKEWNEKNPDATIRINDASILKRVKEINTERRARLLKAMPKDFRATAAESYSE